MQQSAESMHHSISSIQVWDALVVGAGIAGLAAARVLEDAGLRVLVIEKSRGIGGRTSMRRGAGWTANLGAQVIVTNSLDQAIPFSNLNISSTPRAPWAQFLETQRACLSSVTVAGMTSPAPCYVHSTGMNAFCKALVAQNIAFQMRVVALEETATGLWSVEASDASDSRHAFLARHVFLTPPLPQALTLLSDSSFASQCAPLASVAYDPCIAMIVRIPLELRAQWPAPVWMLPTESTANTTDTCLDKVSPKIAGMFLQQEANPERSDVLAIHLSHTSSQSIWNETDENIFQGTLDCMSNIIKEKSPNIELSPAPLATLLSLHRWRYSRCRQPLPMPFFKVITQSPCAEKDRDNTVSKHSKGSLYLAGDAFMRSTIEGAYLSGHAAAQDLLADG